MQAVSDTAIVGSAFPESVGCVPGERVLYADTRTTRGRKLERAAYSPDPPGSALRIIRLRR